MYFLSVFYDEQVEPVAWAVVPDASAVLASVGNLKAAFPTYQRIEVRSGDKHLFTIGREGKIYPVEP